MAKNLKKDSAGLCQSWPVLFSLNNSFLENKVASFFAKELYMDWRMGAAYFESQLIDYDVHSNYGNWMYIAGVGNDPRDRKFNTQLQAERYDNNHKFRKLWLEKTLFQNE